MTTSMTKKRNNRIRISGSDKKFYFALNAILGLWLVVVGVPMWQLVMASFSNPSAVYAGKVLAYPVGFTLAGYEAVFSSRMLGVGYLNTFFYTVFGTALNIAMTMTCAYPLAKRGLPYKSGIMMLFTITMFIGGGMIPDYILMVRLRLINNRLALILPGAMAMGNMILARTFIMGLPQELEEAADIDGCSQFKYFFSVVLPLSGTLLSVLSLYYAVGHWNSYMNAFLYLNDRYKYPLQIFLREVLIQQEVSDITVVDEVTLAQDEARREQMKYALIIVSNLPLVIMYPFVKKRFVKGVMLGSLKG